MIWVVHEYRPKRAHRMHAIERCLGSFKIVVGGKVNVTLRLIGVPLRLGFGDRRWRSVERSAMCNGIAAGVCLHIPLDCSEDGTKLGEFRVEEIDRRPSLILSDDSVCFLCVGFV